MRFLLKCVFWLGGVFLLMPGIINKHQNTAPPVQQEHVSGQASITKTSPDLIEQWLQAGKTLQEITTFCERNPALCVVGKATAQQAGAQAVMRAKDTYEALLNPPAEKPAVKPMAPEPIAESVKPAALKIPIPVPAPRR